MKLINHYSLLFSLSSCNEGVSMKHRSALISALLEPDHCQRDLVSACDEEEKNTPGLLFSCSPVMKAYR
jgi:hypothetical protein